jgi:hypothetical protein
MGAIVRIEDGNDEDGANPEAARHSGVDAGIELGVDGKLRLMALKAGSEQTIASIDEDAELWGEVTSGGAADHFAVAEESESRGGGVDGFGGADYQLT